VTIRVVEPGFLTTIQDLGRYGYAHLGISAGGAADPFSFRIANLLVGNEENASALEMTLRGATLEFEESTVVAITGADCDCECGSVSVPANTAFQIRAGSVLRSGSTRNGVRSYLAIQHGFDVPVIMGSASTAIAGRFGGFRGRRLQKDDVLQIGKHGSSGIRSLRPGTLDSLQTSHPLRVTKGAQQDWFAPEAFAKLFSCAYVVTEQSDRSGLRLTGNAVHPRNQSNLLTDGIPLGAIQVPQDGQPIILFVDQQTTGGYPKIANVIAADLHRVGQLRPRDQVQFAEVSIADAIQALQDQRQWLNGIFVRTES
jgi:antagonist of KipI